MNSNARWLTMTQKLEGRSDEEAVGKRAFQTWALRRQVLILVAFVACLVNALIICQFRETRPSSASSSDREISYEKFNDIWLSLITETARSREDGGLVKRRILAKYSISEEQWRDANNRFGGFPAALRSYPVGDWVRPSESRQQPHYGPTKQH